MLTSKYTLDELKNLRSLLDCEIRKQEDILLLDKIKDQLKERGYYLIVNPSDNLITNLEKEQIFRYNLSLNLELSTWVKEREREVPAEFWTISGLYEEQDNWVSRLGFNYKPTNNEHFILSKDRYDWSDYSYDSPMSTRGIMYVTIFYYKSSCPQGEFEILDLEEENVYKGIIKDNQIYLENEEIGPKDIWSDLNFVLLK